MALKICLAFLLLATAVAADLSHELIKPHTATETGFEGIERDAPIGVRVDGNRGNKMKSEDAEDEKGPYRRMLDQQVISYGALKGDSIPCDGERKHNCVMRSKANPYNRGCSKITNCARDYN